MKKFLHFIWRSWIRFALFFGRVMSFLILTLFYYTIFALFAIPFRFFGSSDFMVKGWRLRGDKFSEELKFEKEY